jgi:hypothetical protein
VQSLVAELKRKRQRVMLKRNLADNIQTDLIGIGLEDVNVLRREGACLKN